MSDRISMHLVHDLKRDWKVAKSIRLPLWVGLLLAFGAAVCAAVFDHFGKLDLVLPTLNSVVVLGYIVAVKWKLRGFSWFWIAMGLAALVHVPLIAIVPWTSKWVPPVAIAAIDGVDFCLMLAMFSVIERSRRVPMHPAVITR